LSYPAFGGAKIGIYMKGKGGKVKGEIYRIKGLEPSQRRKGWKRPKRHKRLKA
jgi:hypothetical protein